ncbi:general secretion pathway protein E/type IV pilus assembly protein PilB [Lacibacter cauensis]|uniref:General secretion pathway protein E/type IV pilus assembly protein PilB n=1 Tax=Lacibacter cauensis TaxID=510947 RepID=A0A562S7V3_9BACT|nr:GspE/PulE family protein [Lacibacter cauensis]TWI77517.1 general secretion pathway protein E/type IV pilus assembly protein PilB [Lacibacter cauensis]
MAKTTVDDIIKDELLSIITKTQARNYEIIPIEITDTVITFLKSSRSNRNPIPAKELEILLGKKIAFKDTDYEYIHTLLDRYYPVKQIDERVKIQYYDGDADSFIKALIEEAKSLKSSDIHIETFEDNCRIRIRIDGLLVPRYTIPKTKYPSLINKIKILASLDIAEKRLPQDGRIFFQVENEKFDIRVSILPTLYGEKIVLRLLTQDTTKIDINNLGFFKDDLRNYLKGINKPHGMVLISGPTGSGKTTTLYATLKLLNKSTKNLLTIEDPIEYTLEGVNQVQLRENIGFTFSKALKTFLRQDPDVIMLGEIRDGETANMAIRASLTGHLVLSTIHTNSAWGIISRLSDMNIPPFLLADTLNTVVAQRLLRILCPHCKKSMPITTLPVYWKDVGLIPPDIHYISRGCDHCFNTGFKGRKAIYEVIPIDSYLSDKIKNRKDGIYDYLKEQKVRTLRENAFDLFVTGATSFDEILPLLTV